MSQSAIPRLSPAEVEHRKYKANIEFLQKVCCRLHDPDGKSVYEDVVAVLQTQWVVSPVTLARRFDTAEGMRLVSIQQEETHEGFADRYVIYSLKHTEECYITKLAKPQHVT